jgi:hypothetical protein
MRGDSFLLLQAGGSDTFIDLAVLQVAAAASGFEKGQNAAPQQMRACSPFLQNV